MKCDPETTPQKINRPGKLRLPVLLAVLAVLVAMAAAWRFTPPGSTVTPEKLTEAARQLQASPLAVFFVIGVYVLGGLCAFPVVILIPATAVAFGSLYGSLYSLLGLLANAIALYVIGRILGRDSVHRMTGSRMDSIGRKLVDHSFATTVTLRVLPVAPYTVVNLVSGALRIKLGHYAFGTALGMAPSVVIMSMVGGRFLQTVHGPSSIDTLLVALAAALLLLMYARINRRARENCSQQK